MDFQGGADADSVSGGTGTDVLRGGGGSDSLSDYVDGDDQLFGEDGDDDLWVDRTAAGLSTVALLDGGAGNDRLGFRGFSIDNDGDRSHSSSEVTMIGGEGADYFYLSDANVAFIDGGPGDDHVAIDLFGAYAISLGAGRDLLELADPRNFFFFERSVVVADFATGPGGDRLDLIDYVADLLFAWDPATNPFGTYLQVAQQGADVVLQIDRAGAFDTAGFVTVLTFQNVTVESFTPENLGGWARDGSVVAGVTYPVTPGDDFVIGLSGGDIVVGSDGADRIRGGAGNDRLEGGEGLDIIVGEFGDDELLGGGGNDQLMDKHSGNDTLRGGGGNDLVYVYREMGAVSRIVLDGGEGDDYVSYIGAVGSSAETTLLGGGGNDNIVLNGDQGALIDAGSGNDDVLTYLSNGTFDMLLGSGSDTVTIGFDSQRDGIASFVVRDFQAGATGDLFRLDPTFDGYWANWDGATSLFKTGHLELVQQGADTLLRIDRSGGGDSFMDFVTFRSATVGGVSQNMRGSNLAPLLAPPTNGDDTIEGTPGDDVIDGLNGADTIYGRAGNDRLSGGEGNDRLFGEEDNDSLGGGAGDDFLVGGPGHDALDGGVGSDRAEGGAGDDTYYVDSATDVAFELPSEGDDLLVTRVNYVLGANIEKMQAAAIGGVEPLSLTGNALGNTIWANFGSNSIDGGAGADVMYGYGGNDVYFVDNAGDAAVEFEGHGTDLVATSVNYVLGANVENMQARSIPGTDPLSLTGNALGNVIWGNFGGNSLDGGAGADVMYGYGGDDTFIVDNAGDAAVEFEGHGTDLVVTSVSYVLGANLENMQSRFIPGTDTLSLTGNALANTIWGNFGDNSLDGGAGADTMYGYGGNDVYYVDNIDDRLLEIEGHGTDLVATSVSYVLDSNVENLQAAYIPGTGALDLTGNGLGNVIWGNFGANVIDGGAGGDLMYGFGGDDLYYADNVGDAAVEEPGGGLDTVVTTVSYTLGANVEQLVTYLEMTTPLVLTGNGGANRIVANDGANVIDGKGGNDTITGGGGADVFAFTTALDAASNVDLIWDFDLVADRLLLAGSAGDPFAALATGGLSVYAFRRAPAAVDADDRIIYNPGTGALSYDSDGVGGAVAVHFASLAAGLNLTAASFTVTGAPNSAPSITSGTTATVAENSPVAAIVYQSLASDPDGDSILYRLGGTDAASFTIDSTGAVRLASPADFETKSSYQFTVIVGDSGGDGGSRAVTLTVTDVLEGTPVYQISDTEPNNSTAAAQAINRGLMVPNGDPTVPNAALPSATITGAISSATDKDMFSVTLNAGELLILDVDGTVTLDSELRVFGPDGTEVARNDDPGSFDPGSTAHEGLSHNMDSVIRVRAPTTGTYTFQIASFQEESGTTSQGGYTLHVLVGPIATPAQINEENIQSLLSGDSWGTLALTYGFTTSGSQYGAGEGTDEIAAGMSALNAVQQAATNSILAYYANLTNLTFSELSGSPGSAHMRYALSLDPDTAHAYHPGPGDGGDSWYNTNKYNNPTIGNYQWMTFMHETGHALGLKHGHDSPALSPDRDSLEFSVMTYRSYVGSSLDDDSGFSNETWGYPQTPMMYDIAALQRLYGADFGFNAGDSVYSWDFGSGAFRVNGVTQWTPGGNRVFMTVWDGGGNDTYDLTNYIQSVTLDLRPGEWMTMSGTQIANLGDSHRARGNVANALLYENDPRSLIENGIGGSGWDTFIGNQVANRFTGGAGSDTYKWMSTDDIGLGASADTITDFENGSDRIDLAILDANTLTPADDLFAFIGTNAFSYTAGELRYQVVNGSVHLYGDTNGDAIANFEIKLENLTTFEGIVWN